MTGHTNPHPIGLTAAERGRRLGKIAEAIAACAATRRAAGMPHDRAALRRDGFTDTEIRRHAPVAANPEAA